MQNYLDEFYNELSRRCFDAKLFDRLVIAVFFYPGMISDNYNNLYDYPLFHH